MMKVNGRPIDLLSFFNTARGAVLLLGAGIVAGGFLMRYELMNKLNSIDGDLGWVICNSVPENRPDVLAALKRKCDQRMDIPEIDFYMGRMTKAERDSFIEQFRTQDDE